MTYRAENGKFAVCSICLGKRYLVSTRDDGREAIERCDECSWHSDDDPHTISDEDAAKLATRDGFIVNSIYPCIIQQKPIVVRYKDLAYVWQYLKRIVNPAPLI